MLNMLIKNFLSPKLFYYNSAVILPWIIIAFGICFSYGLISGLFWVPADYQQGDGFRIMYVHVPSALTAMVIYFIMGCCAILTLVWRIKIAAICMFCSARIGCWFTFLTLVTGAIWGKPMWGTWWIWDARLTSVLVLFFLYIGFIALESAMTNQYYRDRACSVFALVGIINLPIIHYSVIWWATLHQGPSISAFAVPAIAPAMLYPLLSMIAAFFLYYTLLLFINMRHQILLREIQTDWIKEVIV